MCKNIVFTFSEKTLDGHPIIGAGICDILDKEDAIQSFSRINEISLDVTNLDNPYQIDCLLNTKIASLAPDYVHGLALSIRVEGALGPTGGIIGNPKEFGDTATGTSSLVGHNLSAIALPGGPGILIEGEPATLKSIFTNIVLGQNRLVSMKRVEDELRRHKIELALIVTDGTGKDETGMILVYYGDRMEKLIING